MASGEERGSEAALAAAPWTIRPAEPGDLETLVSFVAGVARESEDYPIDEEVVRFGLKRAIADPEHVAHYWLAFPRDAHTDDSPQAAGCLMLTKEWSDWTAAWYWWIQSVYVRPEHRGEGVFDALYEHICSEAKNAGIRSLRLYVDKGNDAGMRAYERVGMARANYHIYTQDLPAAP